MLAGMDSAELSEWLAYDRIEPLPDPYWVGALIASTVARVHGNKCRLDDFLPVPPARLPKSAAENRANAGAYFASFQARAKG